MKTAFAVVAFTGLLSSASAGYIGAVAAKSTTPIHLQEITASGEGLWIGKKTAKYCPASVKAQGACPKNKKDTNFAYGDGSLAMGAIVPGGQSVYIDGDTGRIMYTLAHSADEGSNPITDGWSYTPASTDGAVGTLSWTRGFMACSVNGDFDEGPWEVYARVKGVKFDSDACEDFDIVTGPEQKKADAWQYT